MERFQNTGQPDWDWWGRLWPAPGETLRDLGVSGGESVVEIGSGNGYFALPAARITDPASVYAVDIDESLLSELSALAGQQELDNLHPVAGDARSLAQYLSEAVDIGVLANLLHGVDDPARLIEQVSDVLATDGRFVVINWQARPREETTILDQPRGPPTELRLSPTATQELVEEAIDMTLAAQVSLPPYHYGLVFER